MRAESRYHPSESLLPEVVPFDLVQSYRIRGAIAREESSRSRSEQLSTEIVIELAGEEHAGKPLRTRHANVHPRGQLPLTGLGVAMLLERLIGLDGNPPTLAGLYFWYQLLDPAAYFARLKQIGGEVLTLEVP